MTKSINPTKAKTPLSVRKNLSPRPAGGSLRQHVEDALRKAITSGRFQSGEHLRERDLLQFLNVSRTSLREALRQIAAEGLIVLEPNKGPVVTSVSYEEAQEIYEVRGVLEAQACSSFAERGTSAQIASLREVFQQMTAAANAGDVRKTLELKNDLYKIILDGCGNQIIGQFLTQLYNRVMVLRRTSLSDPARMPEMIYEISALLDAFAAHDPKQAWSISMHHIRQAGRAALAVMRKNELENTRTVRRARSPRATQGAAEKKTGRKI